MCLFSVDFSPLDRVSSISLICALPKNEKTNNVVISIVEGSATAKEIELEFNGFSAHKLGKNKWSCTARPIGHN